MFRHGLLRDSYQRAVRITHEWCAGNPAELNDVARFLLAESFALINSVKEAVMSNIIAGRFDQQSLAQQAREEILRAGFSEEQVSTFYVNPPGQHDLYKIGGDRDDSPGAERTDKGIAAGAPTGGVVGAAIGAATTPALGPVGPIAGALVGAHIGDLVGSLNKMQDDGQQADAESRVRRAGMMLAVSVRDSEEEARAVSVLRSLQAADIERGEGTIQNGDWEDFDPLAPPVLVEQHRH